jgi:hypothetical protein
MSAATVSAIPGARADDLKTENKIVDQGLPAIELVQHSTVLIRCINKDGQVSSGTGFLYGFLKGETQQIIAVVTNRHVVASATEAFFRWTAKTAEGLPNYGQILRLSRDGFF